MKHLIYFTMNLISTFLLLLYYSMFITAEYNMFEKIQKGDIPILRIALIFTIIASILVAYRSTEKRINCIAIYGFSLIPFLCSYCIMSFIINDIYLFSLSCTYIESIRVLFGVFVIPLSLCIGFAIYLSMKDILV